MILSTAQSTTSEFSKKVSSRKIPLMGLHYKSFRFLDTLHHQKLKTPCALGKAIIRVNDCLLSIRVPGHIYLITQKCPDPSGKVFLGPIVFGWYPVYTLWGAWAPYGSGCLCNPSRLQVHMVHLSSEALCLTMEDRKAFVGLIHTRKGQDSEGK